MKFRDAIRALRFKGVNPDNNQLYTIWGEQLDPEHVLEEYPRPQLKRDNYEILNGYWNYCITKEPGLPEAYDGRILVPFSPESVLSGVNRQLKPGEILWYERSLLLPEIPKGKRCILHFGAVDQRCEVYLNNRKVTEHRGGYLPFFANITDSLKEGINIIKVKVTDDSDTSFHTRGKQKLERGGMFYTAQSGIWQTVWMEWVPELYITSLRITPLVDQSSLRVEIYVNDDFNEEMAAEARFQIDIYDREQLIQRVLSEQQINLIELPKFRYWCPEEPVLYGIAIRVCNDLVESYFAMRKVEIKKDEDGIARIFLNNRPYFQNGLLDQGYWPDGLYTAPSDEAFIYDIQMAKELGFHLLRKHIKIEPLRWYYHCDRLGMLVWQDMVNGGEKYNMFLVGYLPTLFPKLASKIKDKHYRLLGRDDAEGRRQWCEECRDTISHLYNIPSIIVWVPFNEGWGQFNAGDAYAMIRELDTTRLVDHASGWFDQGIGDFESIHNYFHPLRVTIKNRPVVLSEYGGYVCYINQHSFSHKIYGYRIYPTKKDFDKAFHQLIEEEIMELKKGGLSAAVFTQLSDVEDEVNGLLTYDRKVCKVTPVLFHP